jgi:urease accessory protein
VQAAPVLEVEVREGRTVCTRLRSEPPLTLRRTGEGVVHQVGSGAGPIGGDEVVLRVRVGAGAALELRSVAAAIALPGPTGAVSRFVIDADIEAGGSLDLSLQPQVVARGADHESTVRVRMAGSSTFRLRDVCVLGRHGEPGGSILTRLQVDRDGRPVIRSELAVGPRWPDSLGPAGIGGARCVGTRLDVDPSSGISGLAHQGGSVPGAGSGSAEVFDLGPGIRLITALGAAVTAVEHALDLRAASAGPARDRPRSAQEVATTR